MATGGDVLESPQFAAVRHNPADPEATYRFAREAMRRGDAVTAIGALERLLHLSAGLDNIRLDLGELYLHGRNPVMAQTYITQALESPSIPDEQRARAQRLLAAALRQQQVERVFGEVFAGLRYDTNANSASDLVQAQTRNSTITGAPQVLTLNDMANPDFSVVLSSYLVYQYEFQNQAADFLELRLNANTSRHFKERREDTTFASINVGPWLTPGYLQGHRIQVRPYANAGLFTEYNELLFGYFGGGLEARKAIDLHSRVTTSVGFDWEEFSNTTEQQTAERRSGPRYAVAIGVDRTFDQRAKMFAGIKGYRKDADAGDESYWGGGVYGGVTFSYRPPRWHNNQMWQTTFSGNVDYFNYDDPDLFNPFVDPNLTRWDINWRVGMNTDIPLRDRLTLRTTLNYAERISRFTIHEYENLSATVGLALRF